MIQNNGLYISATERDAFESLKIGADANNTTYYVGSNFDADTVPIPLQEGQSVDVSFDTLIVIDGEEPTIILQGKKHSRGFREGLQPSLTTAQMSAVNSGITETKRRQYDNYASEKQNKLSDAQMAAVYSGITAAKVAQYDGYDNDKQNALTSAQLDAVNSGITNLKVAGYNSAKAKADASCKARKDIGITSKHCITVSGDPATVTRLRTENNVGGVLALTSALFRLKTDGYINIDNAYNSTTDYDYYFAIRVNGAWQLTKSFVPTSAAGGSITPTGKDPDDEEEENGNENVAEQQQSQQDTVNGYTIADAVPTDNYSGQPYMCVVVMRKNRQSLTSADIAVLTAHNVTIKIDTEKSQGIDAMIEQFNPCPWKVKNYDTRAELSAEFEVFPTFEQGETESEDGYPEGYDHYFAVNIDKASGNEIYDFRRFATDPTDDLATYENGLKPATNYIRIIHDSVCLYNQDFYIPIGSEIDVQEGTQLLAYLNEYPEDADEKDVIVSIQNNCIIHASIDVVELDAEVAEEEGQLSGGGTAITPTEQDPNDAPVNP